MGSSNGSGMEGRAFLMQNWLQKQGEVNILVNRYTHLQIQRHSVAVSVKDLPRQSTLFTSRINNQQAGVCRLFYYHLAGNDQRNSNSSSKQIKEMCVYTDRLQAIKDWSKQRVVQVVQCIKNLITLYGPFRVNESNIKEDMQGEVRVWISHNPVSNYVDFKYVVEEQVVGDLAALLFRRNVDVANLLLGCHTLKEVSFRLTVKKKESKANYSYRSEGVRRLDSNKGVTDKRIQPINTDYRQMEMVTITKAESNLPSPKVVSRSIQKKPDYAVQNKEQKKPSSKSNNFNSYKELYYPKTVQFVNVPSEKKEQVGSRFKPQHQTSFFKSKGKSEQAPIKKTMGSPLKYIDSPVRDNQPPILNSNYVQYKQSVNPITFSKRFSTVVTSPVSGKNDSSNKKRNGNGSQSGSGNKFHYFKTSQQLSSPNDGGDYNQQRRRMGGCDITIINNNVSNFIHNVTHNHIVKMEKKDNQTFQFRPPFENGQQTSAKSKGQTAQATPVTQQPFKGREHNVPVFIKQRRKLSNLLPPKDMHTLHQRQQIQKTIKSTKQRMTQFEKVLNDPKLQKLQTKKSQKNLGYIKDKQIHISPYKYGINNKQFQFSKAPLPFSMKSSESREDNNTSFESRLPLRTKTTQFYHKCAEAKTAGKLAQVKKSTALTEKKKSGCDARPSKYVSREPSILEQPSQQLRTTSPSRHKEEKLSPKKQEISDFKKNLKQQFSSVLGEDIMQGMNLSIPPKTEQQQQQQLQQRMVKDKIKLKKIVFAQLKKQALKVLADT